MFSGKRYINIFILLLTLLYIVVGLYLLNRIYNHSDKYQRAMRDYAAILNFEERLLNPAEWLGTQTEQKVREQRASSELEKAKQATDANFGLIYYFITASIVYLLLIITMSLKSSYLRRNIAFSLIVIALGCLFAGVSIPALEISAFRYNLNIPIRFNVPIIGIPIDFSKTFEGKMFFYHQSKSVIQLIQLLFDSGNYIVAIAITLFSIVIPAVKILLTLVILFSEQFSQNKTISWITANIGKWSMADVFVAALFLAFLSFNNMNTGVETESRFLPGLGFFLSYCLISVFLSHLSKKV